MNHATRRSVSSTCLFAIFALLPLACGGIKEAIWPGGQDPIAPIVAPFQMPQMQRPPFPVLEFDIREFGAVEGGTVKNTIPIRNAIAAAAQAGGGSIVIPAGRWLTGPIHLDNNINLYLSRDAELLFSQDVEDYLPVVFSRHEDTECYKYSAFIYAHMKTNIGISGEGVLNGQGKPWWDWKTSKRDVEKTLHEMESRGVPVEKRIFDGSGGMALRPAFFQPMRCTNVLVEGVTFKYGAFWTITPTYCENVIVRDVRIETEGDYGHTPNGDGVNPSSCRNVLIEDCMFDTGDDCIAIKAGRDKDGLRVNIPTENVVIRNCQGFSGHGGIVIGSETSGGVRNVFAENSRFDGTDRIVRIKTARGRGGVIENMWFTNLSGDEIKMEAIHLNMLYTGNRLPEMPATAATPTIRNIHFEEITCTSGKGYAIELLGLPERPIENITFRGIAADAAKGVNLADVRGVEFVDSRISSPQVPLITVLDGREILFENLRVVRPASPILRVDGARSGSIRLRKIPDPPQPGSVVLGPGVASGAVTIED